MARIVIKTLGLRGVNVDKNPLELSPDELTQAQNAIADPLGKHAGLVNRPGLVEFTTDLNGATDEVLGGITLLEPNGSDSGEARMLYLGRGGAV